MRKALPLVLLVGAALLVCIGVAALGANFFLGRSSPVDVSQWKPPLEQVDPKGIVAATALEPLTGASDMQAIDDALQQGDWESALATVAYSPDLGDANRVGTLLVLGSRYAAARQTVKAAWCYQYAATLSIISPVPSDLVRAQSLLQAAQGLKGLNVPGPARDAVDQAFLIAEYSSTLSQDARSRLYDQIADLYSVMGQKSLSTQARQKSEGVATQTAEDPALAARRPYRLQPATLPASDALNAKTQARITAAKELMDQLTLHPPKTDKDLPDNLIKTLGDRLTEEDSAQADYIAAQDKADADPATLAAALTAKIQWTALKLRVARKGFGLSLVSEWEADAKNIAQDLSDAQDQLFKLDEQQAGTPEKAADADRQVEDVLRAEVVAGRWGLYAYDENDLRSRLNEISNKLRDDQVPTLRLDSYQRGNSILYLLVPDELYGQGDKALPR